MVLIKLSAIFFLGAASITPVVALPTPRNSNIGPSPGRVVPGGTNNPGFPKLFKPLPNSNVDPEGLHRKSENKTTNLPINHRKWDPALLRVIVGTEYIQDLHRDVSTNLPIILIDLPIILIHRKRENRPEQINLLKKRKTGIERIPGQLPIVVKGY